MIAIENVLISDDIVTEKFVCDLSRCKGGCCEDGDAGAPLTNDELDNVKNELPKVMAYLTKQGKAEVEKNGLYKYDKEFGWVTPTIESKVCVYGIIDKKGIVKCGIEQAYNDGKVSWKKPISCHLFPIRIQKSRDKKTEYVNYEPREDLCSAACTLGKQLKVPVYVFLKEALIRKYGTDFYETLEATAKHVQPGS